MSSKTTSAEVHTSGEFELRTFPQIRQATVDLLEASSRKHMIHGLIEIDITQTRQKLRNLRRETDREISLSSFVIYCVAMAVDADKALQAYRDGRNRLFLFNEVDIVTPVEREMNGHPEIIPMVIRSANHKDVISIHSEIETARKQALNEMGALPIMRFFLRLPGFIKRLFFKYMDRHPRQMKKTGGTVMVSCLNMFGSGTGWGIPIASHTLNLTLGGMVQRPVLIKGSCVNHDFLCVTISVDHDLVDGAPLARFVNRFKRMVENGEGLQPSSDAGVG